MVSPSRTRAKSRSSRAASLDFTDTLQSLGPPSIGFVEGKGDEITNLDATSACCPESESRDSCPGTPRLDIRVLSIRGGYDYPRRAVRKQRVAACVCNPGAFRGESGVSRQRELRECHGEPALSNVGRRLHYSGLDQAEHALLKAAFA